MEFERLSEIFGAAGPMLLIIAGTFLAVAGVGSAVNYLSQSAPELSIVKLTLIVFATLTGAVLIVLGSDQFVNE